MSHGQCTEARLGRRPPVREMRAGVSDPAPATSGPGKHVHSTHDLTLPRLTTTFRRPGPSGARPSAPAVTGRDRWPRPIGGTTVAPAVTGRGRPVAGAPERPPAPCQVRAPPSPDARRTRGPQPPLSAAVPSPVLPLRCRSAVLDLPCALSRCDHPAVVGRYLACAVGSGKMCSSPMNLLRFRYQAGTDPHRPADQINAARHPIAATRRRYDPPPSPTWTPPHRRPGADAIMETCGSLSATTFQD
jgi:hypothetical protein